MAVLSYKEISASPIGETAGRKYRHMMGQADRLSRCEWNDFPETGAIMDKMVMCWLLGMPLLLLLLLQYFMY